MQAEKATDSDAAQQDLSNSNHVPAKPDVKLSQQSTLLTVAIRMLCCNDLRIALTLHIALTLPCTHCIVVHVKRAGMYMSMRVCKWAQHMPQHTSCCQ